MYIVYFHLCCDQIFHKLSEGGLWVSFTPFPSSCNTNAFSDGLENATGVNPGVNLELVPVGGDDPGEGVPGDHKAGGVLELPQVGQSPSSGSEYCTVKSAQTPKDFGKSPSNGPKMLSGVSLLHEGDLLS